jgi:hypothetical protein
MPARSRKASTGKSMAVALGVALPLCMSLYTQQRDSQAQRHQQAQAEQTRSQAAAERDRGTAAALNTQLRQARSTADADAARYCELLGQEVQLAVGGTYGPYTVGVLVSRFATHAAAAEGGSAPDACICQPQARGLYASLQPRASRLSRGVAWRELAPLQRQLGDALDECSGDDEAAVEMPRTASTGRSGGTAPQPGATAQQLGGSAPQPDTTAPQLGATAPLPDEPAAKAGDAGSPAGQGVQATAALPELRPRLYIQLPAAPDDSLQCLRNTLRMQGFIVPDFDIVGARAPAATQLRYVSAQEQPAAAQLLQTLRALQPQCAAAGSQLARAVLPASPADYSRLRGNARPLHFELWLGAADAPAAPGS